MATDIELIPGYKKDERRSYVYVQCGDAPSFRKLFEEIKILPDIPAPKAGSLMNKEIQLILPTGETYFAVSIAGDHGLWKEVVETYCRSVGVNSAYVNEEYLLISSGEHVPLSICTLKSSHGV